MMADLEVVVTMHVFPLNEAAPDDLATEVQNWINSLGISSGKDIYYVGTEIYNGVLWVTVIYEV